MLDGRSDNYNVRKLGEMIKDISVAMLTTMEAEGGLRSRPMIAQKEEFDGDLWFFTSANSAKVEEVTHAQDVNISYADPGDQRFVSVSGIAEIVNDRERIEQLWSSGYTAWFPKGLDDPDLALIKVRVYQAEYWDAPSRKMVQIAGFVKSLTSGQRYQPGENEKLELA